MRHFHLRLCVALFLPGLVACGSSPTAPTPAKSAAASSVGPLLIVGPTVVPPGTATLFRAALSVSNGEPPALSNVVWTASGPIKVDAGGDVTGLATGEGNLFVKATDQSGKTWTASHPLLVLPDGTFKLTGRITAADFPTFAVVAARIDVSPTLTTLTDWNGNFTLYGVPAAATLQVTASGYLPLAQPLQLADQANVNLVLNPTAPRLTLSGNYTLAVDVVGACTAIPSDLQHRAYEAAITQTGPNLRVTLTPASRYRIDPETLGGNFFTGSALSTGASFDLNGIADQYPNIVERLPDGTFLLLDGTATTTKTGSALTGTLDGNFTQFDSRFPFAPVPLGQCSGPAHAFTLTAR